MQVSSLKITLNWNYGIHFIFVLGAYDFAKKHPLSSWFVSLVSGYGGSIIQNFLLAQPIMLVLKDERNFITASLIW